MKQVINQKLSVQSLCRWGRRPILPLLALLFAIWTGDGEAAETSHIPKYGTSLYIAGSANAAFNLRFEALLKEKLGPAVRIDTYSRELSTTHPDTLVVTLGSHALNRVQQQQPRPPTLALMVDEAQFAPYHGREGAPVSAIYYNPPLVQQALLGHLILPQATHIAVLARPNELDIYNSYQRELQRFGLELKVFVMDDESALISTLSRALTYGDFLLGVPDPAIFNPRTIKHILLTAYRRNRIVIGPNRAFVNAGSLASVYAPIPVIIADTLRYFEQYRSTGQLPDADFPTDFAVEVNRQVARSLNIPLEEPEALEQSLRDILKALPGKESP